MAQPIKIYSEEPKENSKRKESENNNFSNEVSGAEYDESSEDNTTNVFQLPNKLVGLPNKLSENTPPCCVSSNSPPPHQVPHPVLLSPANHANNTTITPSNTSHVNAIQNENNSNVNSNGNDNTNNNTPCICFQNIDFQQLKANGAPYHCPFCEALSFQVWPDWKQHWYQLHNKQYLGDVIQTMKNNNTPKNILQYVINNKKRNHTTMTNGPINDKLAPKPKQQKISHSYNNNNDHKSDGA